MDKRVSQESQQTGNANVLVVCDMQEHMPASRQILQAVKARMLNAMENHHLIIISDTLYAGGWRDHAFSPTYHSLLDLVKGDGRYSRYKHHEHHRRHPTLCDPIRLIQSLCYERNWQVSGFEIVGVNTPEYIRTVAYGLAKTRLPVEVQKNACACEEGEPGWHAFSNRPKNLLLIDQPVLVH
jgi:hypothetical protein